MTSDGLALGKQLYRDGATVAEAAEQAGVNRWALRTALRASGAIRRTGPRELPVTAAQVAATYSATGSQRETARALNVSRGVVRRRLADVGIAEPPRRPR